jgi:hypothetical protein
MRRTAITLALVGTLALGAPAMAADGPASTPSPEKQCRTERSEMGVTMFRQAYGTNRTRHNAFGKCVSKRSAATDEAKADAKENASRMCKAEEAADPATFAEHYGTGRKKRNAHGKCVSQNAHQQAAKTVKDEVEADIGAAQTCKAERKADPDAFKDEYGTNRHKRNAFGRCVAKAATA